ncbi:helix-turn-helix domain-containing protein [Mariniflexile gromovii]|uniref:Helix-turn-helix domain-containing protein n=1 Tax=Mariniflexile gromovii TaxID=362523 RepID=A0ABS4BSI5_9FLAO|nr:helix-turn-helix domain-containing protein [Mariniflexile gromovii]MBP0903557.1 helix-turn-helix domain-containing protein [Mariniflexile gromovii]
MQQIQVTFPESLTDEIKALKNELKEIKDNFKPKEQSIYLSRKEVSTMLKIDVSSCHNWTKKGILQAYQIGGRVYYKREEVEAAIVKLQN